ncbi:MAG: ADP-glyceromanno-heptose 6-epimerase [Spirochaetota bacterium]
MKNRYIVTGGAGLIGSNLVAELNANGEEDILIVDHLGSSEKWKNLVRLRYSDYIEKDEFLHLLDDGILTGITHILHMGACSSTTESDASYLIQNNYQYTKLLAEKSLQHKIRFLYASSAATYGDGSKGYDDECELTELSSLDMYAYSKHLFDLYAQKTGLLDKIVGLKYFNIFGFGEFHKGGMQSMVLKGYDQIYREKKLKLFRSDRPDYQDGEQKRDFFYVKDAAKVTLHLLFGNYYGLYNVGRGQAETWNELAESLFNAMRVSPNIQYIDMPEHLQGKYQYYTCAKVDKLASTGYMGSITSLPDAIADYVKLLEESGYIPENS